MVVVVGGGVRGVVFDDNLVATGAIGQTVVVVVVVLLLLLLLLLLCPLPLFLLLLMRRTTMNTGTKVDGFGHVAIG